MIELAGLLREIAPMERAWGFFNSSGLGVGRVGHPPRRPLLAAPRQAVARLELISRYPSYHGSTLGALGLSGSRWRQAFELVLEKNAVAPAPDADIRARRTPAAELEFGAGADRGGDRLAAAPSTWPASSSSPSPAPARRRSCRPTATCRACASSATGTSVLMICDETVTAFGRTGTWFGVRALGRAPDIVTFAKGVTAA